MSLNWRTLPKPAPTATSANGRSVVSISVRADCARCARASATGPAPSSATRMRCSWRSEKCEARGEPADAVAVHGAVGDQAHRAPGDVGAAVPGGRAGRGVRVAALAGAEALFLRGRRGPEEADVAAEGSRAGQLGRQYTPVDVTATKKKPS